MKIRFPDYTRASQATPPRTPVQMMKPEYKEAASQLVQSIEVASAIETMKHR